MTEKQACFGASRDKSEDGPGRPPEKRGGKLGRFWTVLVLATIPFYAGAALCGGSLTVAGADLPISAMMFVCPAAAALFAVGIKGWGSLWRFMVTPVRLRWVLLAVVGPPLAVLAPLSISGHAPLNVMPGALVAALGMYLLAAIFEELGWTGVLTRTLLLRYDAIVVGAVVGVAWALWHMVPYLQGGYTFLELVGQCLFTVVFRLFLVQLTVKGRSGVVAVLAHASYNTAWTALAAAGAYSAISSALVMAFIIAILWAGDVLSR